MRLAPTATRLSTLENHPPLLQNLADRRHLGEYARCLAQAGARAHEERSSAQCWLADSQSVKTTGVRGEQRGYDGGKKIKGTKCHLLLDTQGLVLKAKVHARKRHGLRGDQDAAMAGRRGVPPSQAPVAG